jgi:predicted O-methyltransferase YrrM
MRAFNDSLLNDARVGISLVPMGDDLAQARKR